MKLDRFSGVNAGYVLELYERFRRDPASVDAATREAFEVSAPTGDLPAGPPAGAPADLQAVLGTANLAEAIRHFGHLGAQVDPLGSPPTGDPAFSPSTHGVSEDDMRRLPAWLVGGPLAESSANAYEAIQKLRQVYCSTTGFDCAQVFVPAERAWLRDAAEAGRFRPPRDEVDGGALLYRLTQLEIFERFLHRTFPGKTRFSLEGLDMLVPILDEIIGDGSLEGVKHVLIGMAHRGRLNVLAHVLQKPYSQILAEFKDPVGDRTWRVDLGWTGDVKYHAGARVKVRDQEPGELSVQLAPNPSHLEAVNPVVLGMARAAGTKRRPGGSPDFDGRLSVPILIHGDAAFPGQGIVQETLNLSRLVGYNPGGAIHIIANNQLGFTATPTESYGTSYASGLARGFKIPIVHVNADDVIACIEAARLAWAYRARFGKDVLIDLIGYRRHGHNEGDEPAFTQPLLYRTIAKHPTVREIWARRLQAEGYPFTVTPDELVKRRFALLEGALEALQPENYHPTVAPAAAAGTAGRAETGVPLAQLQEINAALLSPPKGFTLHRKLERGRERRQSMLDHPAEPTVDWAAAEELALATILADGTPIRFTGEDVERGTFSHRHAVFHDAVTGKQIVPLQTLPQATATFEIYNSPLSEAGAIGFEFGYNLQAPDHLVIWEAQYGDFINGAQVMLDEFVTSGRAKWGLSPSLVFLLPHGFEGQGPDHSSARPERFLQVAADINMRLVNCTTAAQYFHVLRRQAALLTRDPLPLIILTPKSLLRHPAVNSTPQELTEGRFLSVIDDPRVGERTSGVRRLVLCSGKVYVDLISSERWADAADVAICRVEQLYPFPGVALRAVLERYRSIDELVWLQEEPENLGGWEFLRPLLEELVADRYPLRYIGRTRSSSTAEGSAAWHQINQKALVDQAFDARSNPVARLVASKRV